MILFTFLLSTPVVTSLQREYVQSRTGIRIWFQLYYFAMSTFEIHQQMLILLTNHITHNVKQHNTRNIQHNNDNTQHSTAQHNTQPQEFTATDTDPRCNSVD